MTYFLGIDLGTTYTAAAVERTGVTTVVNLGTQKAAIPSVVVLRDDGSVLTGEPAARRALTEPQRVSREFKRRIGDTTPILVAGASHSAEALMARLLRSVLDDVFAREAGEPAAVCISHPANWGPYKTDLLSQAVQIAGLSDAVFITEPEAAAIAYANGERMEPGETVAVYDLGGGTFDAAVLRKTDNGFELLGRPVGIERLGGIDFDAAVFGHVMSSLGDAAGELDPEDDAVLTGFERLKTECTAARETLSSDTQVTIPVLLPGLTRDVLLTRAEYEAMIRPALGDSIVALRQAMTAAGVAAEDLKAVLLVGGASRTPLVAQMLGTELGRPVTVDADPKHAISTGAALHAAAEAATRGVSEPDATLTDETGERPVELEGAHDEQPANAESFRAAAPTSGRPSRVRVAVGAVAALVLVTALGAYIVSQNGDSPSAGPQASAQPEDIELVRATVDAGSVVPVRADAPLVGTSEFEPSEDPAEYAPIKQVQGGVRAYIDLDNATNRQFYDFLSFTSTLPDRDPAAVWADLAPDDWRALMASVPKSFSELEVAANDPVTGVSFPAADEYCEYALRRLPTEIEWEIAARSDLIDVKGVLNWTIRSSEYGPTPDGSLVLRGVPADGDDNLYYRTIGDTAEHRDAAGIRCAADDVVEVEVPTGEILYLREFSPDDVATDWPDFHDPGTPTYTFGYHAPNVFHIENRDLMTIGVSSGSTHGLDQTIEIATEVRKPESGEGGYAYGIVANGTAESFLAFTVTPVDDGVYWCLSARAGSLFFADRLSGIGAPGGSCLVEGEAPAVSSDRVTLAMNLGADTIELLIDGESVGVAQVPVVDGGAFGVLVENFESDLVSHLHFDTVSVQANSAEA